jgi:tetratricopeptide (TPR) repeat protein
LRRNTESLSNYSIAIFLNPKFTNAFINRGLVKGALKDIDGALSDLDQALIIDPKNLAALVNRGVTYGGLNKPLLAITDFDRVIQIDPNYADAFRNRGLTKHLIGDKKGACDDWSKSKDLGIVDAAEWLAKLCR